MHTKPDIQTLHCTGLMPALIDRIHDVILIGGVFLVKKVMIPKSELFLELELEQKTCALFHTFPLTLFLNYS